MAHFSPALELERSSAMTIKNPVIADNKPLKVHLKEGQEYHFCTCGKSRSQPSCDGSHLGTSFLPRVIISDKDQDIYMCACKHTRNSPYCDGTHNQFASDEVGTEGPGVASEEQLIPSPSNTPEEPNLEFVHQLAKEGLSAMGHHGPMGAMGVPVELLPKWDDIQVMVAQLDRKPLMEDADVNTELVIGPEARKPLTLSMPLFISDMSFGALSEEAKVALARGAELADTGICSGEGGMLPEERQENSRYLYELASGMFGYADSIPSMVQAFHFKGGQGAKTGIGGHLPASKNIGKISEVRGIPKGQPAISPPTFANMNKPADFRKFADKVREISGGIPIGFKLSANHIERDIQFALDGSADYVILDGRGGGTGAAPLLFRDHISVPTIPALARARQFLDKQGASKKITLIITGGLRVPSDFIKALALGADGIAISNSAMQAIGCIGARICNSNNCPAGIATQNPELRKRLNVEHSAQRLCNFLSASKELIQVMARACGHSHVNQFSIGDLATFDLRISQLTGIKYAGVSAQG